MSYQTYSDGELVRMLGAGDHAAFEALYLRWLGYCIDSAYKRLNNREVAEDIAQTVFIRIWNKRDSLAIDNMGAYLNRAVRNGVASYVSREKTPTAFHEPFEQIMMGGDRSADAVLLEKDLMQLLVAYAQSLPEQRRRVFLHYILEKLSTQEISEKMGISRKTVQNTLRTVLLDLQERLGPVLLLCILAGCNRNFTIS